MKKQVAILGGGTGNPEELTGSVRRFLADAEEVYAPRRLAELYSDIRSDMIIAGVTETPERVLASEKEKIAVLVTGDPGFFSAAKSLREKLAVQTDVTVCCGVSSLQYLCAKVGVGYERVKIVSLHGRENFLLGAVSYHPLVFVLTGGTHRADEICAGLEKAGLGHLSVTAGENLSMENERILTDTASRLAQMPFGDLAVLLIRNPDFVSSWVPLRDEDFIRGKIPMTKEEIRWISAAALCPAPTDVIYDVGAGTGSLSLELGRRACDGAVYAIEQKEEGISLIEENRRKLGGYNVLPVAGTAPGALTGLPKPDKAFIGGSSGNLREIVALLKEKNPFVRIVVNAITLETLNESVSCMEEAGFSTEISCVNSARSKKVGGYHMMTANNPVYVITGIPAGEGEKHQ